MKITIIRYIRRSYAFQIFLKCWYLKRYITCSEALHSYFDLFHMPCRLKTYISLFLTTCFYAKTTSLVEGYIHHHPFWWALSVYLAMIKYFKGVFVENIWQDSGSWIWYHFILQNVSWFDYNILYYYRTSIYQIQNYICLNIFIDSEEVI